MTENITLKYLKDKNSSLGRILNSIYDAAYIVDSKRKILFWNKAAETITGYSSAEVAGRSCSENILNHIDANGKLLCRDGCPLLASLKSGRKIEAKVYPFHKSKKRFPVLTRIAPIKNSRGKVIAAIEIFRDISGEEDFRLLQEKFNKLIRRYVSSATFSKVLSHASGGAKAGAGLRDLTVLYLDIVGFTNFSEKSSPEDVVKMLNDIFGICEVITKECAGDIDKFIGDAVMAVFIDANDAVEAGGKILKALKILNAKRKKAKKPEMSVRIGINSGIMLQGEIGTAKRRELAVIGDAVNTASRIESVAKPNRLTISESTYARLRDASSFKKLPPLKLKGKRLPVTLYSK